MNLPKKIKSLFSKDPPERNPFWNFDRSSPRCEIDLYVRDEDSGFYVERSGNIGFGGFAFRVKKAGESYAPETRIAVRFLLPDTHTTVHATGLVLGHSADGCTVRGRFYGLELEDQRLLARWLHDCALDRSKN